MVFEIDFPKNTQIHGKESTNFYRDSFQVNTSVANLAPRNVYHGVFGFLPKSVQFALKLRNSIVKHFGFSSSNTEMSLPLEDIEQGKKAGFLTIELVTESEVICGAYERNMDMWLSVLKMSDDKFAISTLVNLKTRTGKLYMAFIKPFHKMVAKYCINQALKAGRI